jgi:hypothetical protein
MSTDSGVYPSVGISPGYAGHSGVQTMACDVMVNSARIELESIVELSLWVMKDIGAKAANSVERASA